QSLIRLLCGSVSTRRGWGAPPRPRRSAMKTTKLALVLAFLTALRFPGIALAQTDPGVRSNTGINAGQPLASVSANPNDLAFFQTGLAQFKDRKSTRLNSSHLVISYA